MTIAGSGGASGSGRRLLSVGAVLLATSMTCCDGEEGGVFETEA